MNTKRPAKIRDRSFYQMIEYSCWELFSPRSKKSLLNYKDLDLIDWKQLKLINPKDFQLLNFSVIASFVEYVGVLSTIVIILGSVAFRITWDSHYYSQKLSFSRLNNAFALEKSKHNFETTPVAKTFAYDTSTLLLDSVDVAERSEAVLGIGTSIATEVLGDKMPEVVSVPAQPVSDEDQTAKEQTFLENSCSFSVDGTLYSSGSSVVLDKPRQKMCVRTSVSNVSAVARVIAADATTEKDLNVSSGCFVTNFDEEKDSIVDVILTKKNTESNLGSCNLLVSAGNAR